MASSLVPFTSVGRALGGDPLLDLHRQMNQLFDDFLRGGIGTFAEPGRQVTLPRVDVRESDAELAVVADLPGVAKPDLDIRIDGDVVTISGEKKSEREQNQESYRLVERSVGRFQRSLQLPFEPDPEQVKADFENGVLTVHVPKQGNRQRSRRIEVSGSPGGGGQADGPAPTTQARVQQGAGRSGAGSESPDDVPEAV